MDEPKWSKPEKKAARKAFDLAYQRQCKAIRAQVNKMIANALNPSDIWEIHDYLTEQRRIVDKTFDYRYSVLLTVFSGLLRYGWLTEADLAALEQDKIDTIKRWVIPL